MTTEFPRDVAPAETLPPLRGAAPPEPEAGGARGLTPATFLLALFAAFFLYKVQAVVVLLIVGILLATAIAGPVEFLTRRARLPRPLAILLVYLALLALLLGFFSLIIPPLAEQVTSFVRAAPALLADWRARLEGSDNPLLRNAAMRVFRVFNDQLQGGTLPLPTNLAVGFVSGVGGGLVSLFTVFLIAFYWLTEKARIKRAVGRLAPTRQQGRIYHLWEEVELKLGSWIRGQLLLMLVIGASATVAYGLLGLPFWFLLGLIAGLTEAIPNLGPVLGAIPAVLLALSVDWKLALAVVAFVTVLQLVENAVLVPRIMKGALGLSPLTVILAILAGGEFRGVAGALLAVPIAGALSVILADVLQERQAREAAGQPRRGWFRRRPANDE